MAILDNYTETEFPIEKNRVFDAMCQAILMIKGMKLETSDKLLGRILVKSGISLHSWGENITIQIKEIDENKTKVEIKSLPIRTVTKNSQADYGKNRKNIEVILSTTSNILQQRINPSIATPIENKYLQQEISQSNLNIGAKKWYNNNTAVILLCIFFFPVGLYGLWKSQKIKQNIKIAVTIIIALFYVVGISQSSKTSDNNSANKNSIANLKDTIKSVEPDKQTAIDDKEKAKQNYLECRNALILFIDKIYYVDSLVSIDQKQMIQYGTYYRQSRTDVYTYYKALKIAKNTYNQAMMAVPDIQIGNSFPDSIKEVLSKIKEGLSSVYSSKAVACDKFMEILDANGKTGNLEKLDDAQNEIEIANHNQLVSVALVLGLESQYDLINYYEKRHSNKKNKKRSDVDN